MLRSECLTSSPPPMQVPMMAATTGFGLSSTACNIAWPSFDNLYTSSSVLQAESMLQGNRQVIKTSSPLKQFFKLTYKQLSLITDPLNNSTFPRCHIDNGKKYKIKEQSR